MLSVEKLDAGYGGSQILWSVDLSVSSGQVVCLMGRNGVGKTTLLKTIMGLLPARGGRVVLDGVDVTRWAPDRRARATFCAQRAPSCFLKKSTVRCQARAAAALS